MSRRGKPPSLGRQGSRKREDDGDLSSLGGTGRPSGVPPRRARSAMHVEKSPALLGALRPLERPVSVAHPPLSEVSSAWFPVSRKQVFALPEAHDMESVTQEELVDVWRMAEQHLQQRIDRRFGTSQGVVPSPADDQPLEAPRKEDPRDKAPFSRVHQKDKRALVDLFNQGVDVWEDDGRRTSFRVFARFRPPPAEKDTKMWGQLSVSMERRSVMYLDCRTNHIFQFDGVFPETATQEDVYVAVVAQCVKEAMEGYNSTILCYGQTGSGKRYSLVGKLHTPNEMGMLPRAAQHVFSFIREDPLASEWSVDCSFMEICQGVVFDLLGDLRNPLQVIKQQRSGRPVIVQGLTARVCKRLQDVVDILERHATHNTSSLPAHSFRIKQRARDTTLLTTRTRTSCLHFVEFAGSEVATSDSIDESLSVVERVIFALTEGPSPNRKHVPYGESRLTQILQESFGGNAKAALLVHGCAHHTFIEETIHTLKFAQRATFIENTAVINQVEEAEGGGKGEEGEREGEEGSPPNRVEEREQEERVVAESVRRESPFASRPIPEGVVAHLCTTTFPKPVLHCAPFVPVTFDIQACRADGVPVESGGHAFTISRWQGPAQPLRRIIDHEDGTYTVVFTAFLTGTYVLLVELDGVAIPGSPFTISVEFPNTTARLCTLHRAELAKAALCGTSCAFNVQACDQFGNNCRTGGDWFVVNIVGPSGPVSATVIDKNNGMYTMAFTPRHVGSYSISVGLGGGNETISESPFSVLAHAGEPSLQSTLLATEVEAGCTARLPLRMVDVCGNVCPMGSKRVEAHVSGPDGIIPCRIEDQCFLCFETPATLCVLDVELRIGEKAVDNSPFALCVVAGPLCLSCCRLEGFPDRLTAGTCANITVVTFDKNNRRISKGGHEITGRLHTPCAETDQSLVVQDKGDGTYTTEFVYTKAGRHTLTLLCGDVHVGTSPVSFTVDPGLPDPSASTVEGPKESAAGSRCVLVVCVMDSFHNPLAEPNLPLTGEAVGAEQETRIPLDLFVEGGLYHLSFTPTTTCKYTCTVWLEGKPVGAAGPLIVTVVAGPAFGPHCCATELWRGSLVAGHTGQFLLQAKDRAGNLCRRGGEHFDVQMFGPNDSITWADVEDNRDGTYTVTFSPTVAGTHEVTATLNGENLAGSPFKQLVSAAELSLAHCQVEGTGARKAVCGQLTSFLIRACDRFRNTFPEKITAFKANLLSERGVLACTTVDNRDGTYAVQYTVFLCGKYRLVISWEGSDLPLSPLSIVAVPGAAQAEKCRLNTTDLDQQSIRAFCCASLSLTSIDAHGNGCIEGGGQFRVEIHHEGGESVTGDVDDLKNGTYRLTFVPICAGTATIHILLDGFDVAGSPFTPSVLPFEAVLQKKRRVGEKARFFRLHSDTLFKFRHETEKKPLGRYRLVDIMKIEKESASGPLAFDLVFAKGVRTLIATDTTQKEEWVTALSHGIRLARSSRQTL